MAEFIPVQPHYFLHTLVGATDNYFGERMSANGREWPLSPYKIDVVLDAQPESAEGITHALGLDIRQVMATVSKVSPATTYHNSYGLVLEGEAVGFYDNDSGKGLRLDGTYSDSLIGFTKPTTLDELTTEWYDKFVPSRQFTWNEVILAKGARVIGAFYDPRHNPGKLPTANGRPEAEEYEMFLDKIKRCSLKILEIEAKFGVTIDSQSNA